MSKRIFRARVTEPVGSCVGANRRASVSAPLTHGRAQIAAWAQPSPPLTQPSKKEMTHGR